MLSSCEKHHKFCYVVTHKHMGYSKSGYPYYYLYMENDSISQEKGVTPSTYYESKIGDNICFNEQVTNNLGIVLKIFIISFVILFIIGLFMLIRELREKE